MYKPSKMKRVTNFKPLADEARKLAYSVCYERPPEKLRSCYAQVGPHSDAQGAAA